jgi:putative peptide zinc metalloprotease protein
MTPVTAPKPSPAATLRTVHVGLREDLEVSRHVFRGEPCYVVRDPMTFQSQRLGIAEYEIFVSIHSERSLSDTFSDLCSRQRLTADDEDGFYDFVVRLHRLGFLQLPISDDKLLYQRYRAKQQAKRREKLMSFLFLRIPLWNPDSFLERTRLIGRIVFHPAFFAGWVLLVLSATFVGLSRRSELSEPLNGLLLAQNIPLLWTTLIVLKCFHEMGHAYSCKYYGGHVPETGAYLILFTPCAYLDATAAWGFPKRRHRIIVSLAGMYVESLFAAVAIFVWASTEPSLLNSLAYNVVFLAGVTTVLFNINPLMRYDGYYILSDWLEIPNLRARATQQVQATFKRWFLGITDPAGETTGRLGWILLSFGVFAVLYRFALLFTLATVLASKVLVIGIVVGFGYLVWTGYSSIRRLAAYLWYAPETAPVRMRAVAISVVLFLLLPAALLGIPLPGAVHAAGSLSQEHENIVRAATDGFIAEVASTPGSKVVAGATLVRLSSDHPTELLARAAANLRAAEIRRDALRHSHPAKSAQQAVEAGRYVEELERAKRELAELDHRAPTPGVVTQAPRPTDVGLFVREGSPLAAVSSGAWQVEAILTESQIVLAEARIGDQAEFRPAGDPAHGFVGRLTRIAPAGSRNVGFPELTQLGGGDIAVDPTTQTASQPFFVVTVQFSTAHPSFLHGMTGQLRLSAAPEPLGTSLARRASRFFDRILLQ